MNKFICDFPGCNFEKEAPNGAVIDGWAIIWNEGSNTHFCPECVEAKLPLTGPNPGPEIGFSDDDIPF